MERCFSLLGGQKAACASCPPQVRKGTVILPERNAGCMERCLSLLGGQKAAFASCPPQVLFVAKGIDGIQVGGLDRGQQTEYNPDNHGEKYRQENKGHTDGHRSLRQS